MNTKVDGISPKQERFINEYLQNGNVTLSAQKTGISKNTVYKWFNKGLASVIADRQKQIAESAIKLMQTATMKATQYLLEVIENSQSPPADKLKAADLLTRNGLKAWENEKLNLLADLETQLEGMKINE